MSSPPNALRTFIGLAVIGVLGISIAGSAIFGHRSTHFSVGSAKAERVTGSGKMVTVTRPLGDAHQIVLEDAVNATITIGDEPSMTLTADDNVEPLISTETEDGKLTVKSKADIRTEHRPKVTITIPSLDRLEVNASEVSVTGFKGGTLNLEIDGAGDVTATGTLDEAELEINGAGKLSLQQLEVATMKLEINGAGDAKVKATQSLNVEINGAGNVVYSGSPAHLQKEINGMGSIRAAT
jgi:hypothetical protein